MEKIKKIGINIGLGTLLYAIFYLVVTSINTDSFRASSIPGWLWIALGVVVTLLYIVVILVMAALVVKLQLKWKQELICAVISLILLSIVNPKVIFFCSAYLGGMPLGNILVEMDYIEGQLWQTILTPLVIIFSGSFFGALLSRIVREGGMIFPIAIVISLVDIWGVYFGFVDMVAEAAPGVITGIASAETPITQTPPPETIAHMSPTVQLLAEIAPPEAIGIGDFLFSGFFLALAVRFSHSLRNSIIGMGSGIFLASMIFTFWGDKISYLPGLVFIGLGYVIANLKEWKCLTKSEWIMTAAISGVMGIVILCSALSSV